jgi:monoamine oxidase
MKNDVIILGAGVCGLYLGIELLKQNRQVVLLEKTSRLGGRIDTIRHNNHILEAGAGRFSECHQMLFNLLKRYNLFDKKYPITKYADILLKNKKNYSTNIEDYYKIIFSKSKNYKNEYLATKYTYEILEEILGSKELVNHFISIYGYTGDVMDSNALCGLNILACDYYSEQFYVLIGGLDQLVDKMKDEFLHLGGTLKLLTSVKNIYRSPDGTYLLETKKKDTFICDQLVLAIPPTAIQKLNPKNSSFDFLNYVKPIPLLRVYFYYDTKNEALTNLKKIITDLDIHYIIPIDGNTIMISYTDSKLADDWNSLYKENEELFYQKILSEFTKCTGVHLEIPDKVFMEHWKEGIYVWTPGFDYIQNYDKVIHPLENLFISNEGVSKKQGWIEGSLLMANDVLEKMKK